MSLRITLRNIKNIVRWEGEDTLLITVPRPGTDRDHPVPVDVCHDHGGVVRATSGVCPIHGAYTVYEEFFEPDGWVTIGQKSRGKWLWGKENCRPTKKTPKNERLQSTGIDDETATNSATNSDHTY